MPPYPFMPIYGAPMPGAWAPPFPGNPYGPVLAAPPASPAKASSTAPPKPPAPSSTKKSPPTEEKVTPLATGVHYVSLHPTVAKLKSVKCGESSPGGDRIVTIEEWQKFCNATDGTKKVNPQKSLKTKLLVEVDGGKAKSVQSADFGSEFQAFLQWNKLRKEAKQATEAANAKLVVKVDKTASEVVKAAAAKAKSEKRAKSAAHSTNSYACPTIPPGVNYLFPSKTSHTMLHIFNKTSRIWSSDPKYAKQTHQFKIFKTPTHLSVGNIIERVRGGDDPKERSKGWAVTEVVEGGSGGWKKGTTIAYDDDKAKGTLESMGWDQTRGSEGRPPVWLVVHKV